MAQPTEATFWGWAVRGIGGAVAVAESLVDGGPRINEEHFRELEGFLDRLAAVVSKLETQITEGNPIVRKVGRSVEQWTAAVDTAKPIDD